MNVNLCILYCPLPRMEQGNAACSDVVLINFLFLMCYIVARRSCGTMSHMLWYDGYEVAYIMRRRNNKDTATCEMYDSLYKQMVFTIL